MRALRDIVDELLNAQVRAKLFGGQLGDLAPRVGRLHVLERLGAGAMGTVFAAYDPRLDRKVAVKVLREASDASRVLAEARALAKLAHPNVVAVHDADEAEGLVYIVMELAPGTSLRTWMQTHHEWADTLRILREAAAGVAAAHAAGLVHRDIKPDNILVGEDRARVVDFGLANIHSDSREVSGTPLYMAPEVLEGAAATPQSDQFSFGVTMFEALYGRRPADLVATGRADTVPAGAASRAREEVLADLTASSRRAANAPRPPGTSVPAWVHQVITRALASEPGARFPSMSALAASLGRTTRRRKLLVAIGAAGVIAGVGIGAFAMRGKHGDPCTGAPARVASVWDDAARTRVRAALGQAAWLSQTIAELDANANAWHLSYRRVCSATRISGEQSERLLDLRMRCLDRSLERVDALVHALGGVSASDMVARASAPAAVAELPPPAACETFSSDADLALPADKQQRETARSVEIALDVATAQFSIAQYDSARTAARAAMSKLGAIDAPRLRAALLALEAASEARIGSPDEARKKLDEAQLAAAAAAAPQLEYEIWVRRMRNELFAGDPGKVIEWATFARAAARRTGRDGAELDGIIGEALRGAGKLDQSRQILEHALASKDDLRPDQRAIIEMNLGSVELALGDSTAALATLTKARDRVLSALGDHFPELALYDDKLAAALRARGKLRDALALADKSIQLRADAFGPNDRAVATSLLSRAQTYLESGELAKARDDIKQALAIRETVFGKDSARLGEVYAARGDISAAAGENAEASGAYERALELDPRLAVRLDIAARRFAIGEAITLDDNASPPPSGSRTPATSIPPLAAGESPSVDRVAALAVRAQLLAKAGRLDEARALAAALRARYRAGLDASLASAVAAAQLAAGDRTGAADLLAAVAPTLGNEPSRTALSVFTQLARASDTQAQAAARAAIALYQAMPQLDRSAEDEMWTISRKSP